MGLVRKIGAVLVAGVGVAALAVSGTETTVETTGNIRKITPAICYDGSLVNREQDTEHTSWLGISVSSHVLEVREGVYVCKVRYSSKMGFGTNTWLQPMFEKGTITSRDGNVQRVNYDPTGVSEGTI